MGDEERGRKNTSARRFADRNYTPRQATGGKETRRKISESCTDRSARLLYFLFDLYDRYGVYGRMGEGGATGQAESRRIHFPSDLASERRHRVCLFCDTAPG